MPDASRLPDRPSTLPEIAARSPAAHRPNGVRPAGLPLLSTAPMSFKEREALRDLARALRLTADRVDEALITGRVDRGMDACTFAGELGIAAQRAAAVIGSGR